MSPAAPPRTSAAHDDSVVVSPTTGEPSASSYPVLSVVDVTPRGVVAVWHVHTAPATMADRFSGGWLIDPTDAGATGRPVQASVSCPSPIPSADAAPAPASDTLELTFPDTLPLAGSGAAETPIAPGDSAPEAGAPADGIATGDDDVADAEFPPDCRSGHAQLADLVTGTWIITRCSDRPEWMSAAVGILAPEELADCVATAVDEYSAAVTEYYAGKTESQRRSMPTFTTPHLITEESVPRPFHGEPAARSAWLLAMAVGQFVDAWLDIESSRRQRGWMKDRFGPYTLPVPLPHL